MDCKRALEDGDGDLEKAEEFLKSAGLAAASRRATRDTNEGLVASYIHSGGRIGALVEVNCETDFVARTSEMQALTHDLAMQVAAMSPSYVNESDRPDDDDRPTEEVCLLNQTFIKDPSLRVDEVVQEVVAKMGENIRVHRFTRFALGE
ncbi:elongation factor Ts [SAR202 cluster bacterium AD-804-J14_MRT_500m]|nr:elongation factor Ts [SAR202 cluster bacterium AD-804-J14_MRT_500m]